MQQIGAQVSATIPLATYDKIKAIAKSRGHKVSHEIRLAVLRYVEAHDDKASDGVMVK